LLYWRRINPPGEPEIETRTSKLLTVFRPWLGLALVCGGFSLSSAFRHVFWTPSFLQTLFQQAAVNVILAVGMTLVILTAGIDLSVGSVLALCGVTLGLTVKTGPPPFLCALIALPIGIAVGVAVLSALKSSSVRTPMAGIVAVVVTFIGTLLVRRGTAGGVQLEGAILAALLAGIGCGLINGLVVTFGRVPSFIATLGMYTAARGLTVYATDGTSVSGLPLRLGTLGQEGTVLAVAAVVVACGTLLLTRTRTGRYLRAIGGNEEAARLSGVDLTLYKTLAYVLAGLASGVAAVMLTARFMVADTGAATGAELNAIAAVVIGGTSLSGGRGSVLGSLVGALTIAVLDAGLVLVGVRDTLQGVVIGAVIVATVVVDRFTGGTTGERV